MKVVLVNPPRYDGVSVIREERCEITDRYSVLPPYSLLQIASLLRERGHAISLIDANGEDLSYEELTERLKAISYEALLFRFTPTTFDWDMRTAKISKGLVPEATTIGICWTLGTLSTEVLDEVAELDVYLRHEYEVVACELIDAVAHGGGLSGVAGITYREGGETFINADAEPAKDYDALPLPAYDLLPGFGHYFINTPAGKPFSIVYTSKGCPYGCIYCTVARTKWKKRSAESILGELEHLKKNYSIKTVSVFDETFTIDRDRVVAISKGIETSGLKIKRYCHTRVELVDEELVGLLYRGGCRGISYGIESASQDILDTANKGTTVEQAEKAIRRAKKTGIKVYCSFILGLPGETEGTLAETRKFVRRVLPTGAQFNVVVPYPGTELYERVYGDDPRPATNWRALYQDEAVIGTEALSPDDLDRARVKAYRSLYLNPRWWAQNTWHVARHPEDFEIASKYVLKIFNNFLLRGMKHAH
jgi:radical SAM superfamily enzyme YgiQ (UPF0313 family)